MENFLLECWFMIKKKVVLTWNLVNVYGAAQPKRKVEFLAELSRLYKKNTLPCLIGGGLNIIRK